VVLLASGVAAAQSGSSVPDLAAIVAGLEQAQITNRARLVPYSVTRDYRLLAGEERKLSSQVVAEINFLPPETKTYSIRSRSGGGRGEKIVRQILERESLLARDPAVPISGRNYDFSLIGVKDLEGRRCYLLAIKARRADKNLLDGLIWVDGEDFRVHRFEGKLAKNPSWWVKDISLVFTYGEVAGMWLQTAVEATALVRLAGEHSLVARDVEYRTSTQLALRPPRQRTPAQAIFRPPPPRPTRPSPAAAVGAGVIAPP
jgi:hypothetical protein